MPTSEAKPTASEPQQPVETRPKRASTGPLNLTSPYDDLPLSEDSRYAAEGQAEAEDGVEKPRIGRGAATSRWVDYDTHELLNMISELEDERRWARLREGIWIALLLHIALLPAAILLPKYVFMPRVIDPFDAIKQRKDLTYLDLPPDVIRKLQAKPKVAPTPTQKQPRIDKKTLEALNKPAPPLPKPEVTPEATTPPPNPALTSPVPKVEQAPPQPSEAPRPQAVPDRQGGRGAEAGLAPQARSGPGKRPPQGGIGGARRSSQP